MHIITPHALPMFRDDNVDHRKKRKLDRKDPLKSHKPEQALLLHLLPLHALL